VKACPVLICLYLRSLGLSLQTVLAKPLESLVSEQLKELLIINNILSDHQSGFRKKHNTTTAALQVGRDVIESLDTTAALFIDLSKAFDTVHHAVLKQRLLNIGLSEQTVCWFKHYLSNRSQWVQAEGIASSSLDVIKGVPQGSVLGPLLFTIYINSVGQNVPNANVPFHADDAVIYCSAAAQHQDLFHSQTAFDTVQHTLKYIVNPGKTKLMSKKKKKKSH